MCVYTVHTYTPTYARRTHTLSLFLTFSLFSQIGENPIIPVQMYTEIDLNVGARPPQETVVCAYVYFTVTGLPFAQWGETPTIPVYICIRQYM